MEELNKVIKSIIEKEISKNQYFDAHAIIEFLIQHRSDLYLNGYEKEWGTKLYHSKISKEIQAISEESGGKIERIKEGQIWSLNIHKKHTENACWKKVS